MSQVYKIITDKILALLEQGVVPWRRPWNGADAAPKNLLSKKEYRGINTFLLSTLNYSEPWFLTFNQAKELGGTVKKGEKGTPVVFYSINEKEDKAGNVSRFPFLRYYTVFNLSQCDLPEGKMPAPLATVREFTPVQACLHVVNGMPSPPTIEHNAKQAFYRPSTDSVHLPPANTFVGDEEYYSTLFHELAHSTGHSTRLDRALNNSFGDDLYSREELIAEMTASFLMGHCGLTQTLSNNAAYLHEWMKRLQADSKLLVTSASAAQKAADYILNREQNE